MIYLILFYNLFLKKSIVILVALKDADEPVYDGESEDADDEADEGIEDSVLRGFYLTGITA